MYGLSDRLMRTRWPWTSQSRTHPRRSGTLLRPPVEREAALRRSDSARILLMALFGALLGLITLAWECVRAAYGWAWESCC